MPLADRPAHRSIVHADLDAFFASVEQRDNPRLRGRPIAVGGGVVLAASYEAKAFGVQGAMGGSEARRLCPSLTFVPPRMRAYSEASDAVFGIFRDTTPVVEGLSIDEAFLDVTGLRRSAGSPRHIAERLRERVRDEVSLPISVGIATTKFLAKVASAQAKPDGLVDVAAGHELEFLWPLPVSALWGVGPVTRERLEARGVFTVADVAALADEALVEIAGRAMGHKLAALARNDDPRRVRSRGRRSVGAQRALGRRPTTAADHDAVLVELADRVTRRMRGSDRVGRSVVLRVRFGDFTTVTRSVTLRHSSASHDEILSAARRAYANARPLIDDLGCTLLGISVSGLDNPRAVQLALPLDDDPNNRLDAVVDGIRDRFGTAALTRAVLLGRAPGIEMPTLAGRERA